MHLQRLSEVERYPGFTFTSPDNLAKQIAYGAILDLLAREQSNEAARESRGLPYASLITILFLVLLTPLAADQLTKAFGLTFAAPIALLGGIGGLLLALIYWRYVEILGAGNASARSLERRTYDTLRASVAAGGLPAVLYSHWLTRFLGAVDHFFGDAGMGNRTLFPRAFGLRTPAPLWTAPAFDRCLLLALIYPIVTILIVWAVSGHVGPAEEAFRLKPDFSGLQRGSVVAAFGVTAFVMRQYARAKGWKSVIWLAISPIAIAAVAAGTKNVHVVTNIIAALVAGVFASNFAIAYAMVYIAAPALRAVRIIFSVAGTISIGVGFTLVFLYLIEGDPVGPFMVNIAIAAAASGGGAIAVAVAVWIGIALPIAGALTSKFVLLSPFAVVFALLAPFPVAVAVAGTVASLNEVARGSGRQGIFLTMLMGATTMACLVSASQLSHLSDWNTSGPLLLFLGLLTLVNAPFDWASLGLTRALLRRGLELGGWWPYLLALVDALLAGVIIALLALAMVVGVQAFDALAVHGGGKPVLPLLPLFNGLSANPAAPEYWWLYALLLSTMIPSLVNLAIGGTALARTAPGLPSLLLRSLPAGQAVPAFDRAWLALVLTMQVAGGVILGIAAQALLAVGLIRYIMPWLGLGLLDLARTVAEFDLPARIGQLF
jgi:hypothetical protein